MSESSSISQVVIDKKNIDYSTLFSSLLGLTNIFCKKSESVPTEATYNKPCTQLPNIESYMNLLSDARLAEFKEAAQYIDLGIQFVGASTRNLKFGQSLVSNDFFKDLPIAYHYSAFGNVNHQSKRKWLDFYEQAFSQSSMRHSGKKAEKILFVYYRILDDIDADPTVRENEEAQFIIGAVQYAIYVKYYMAEHHNDVMSYIGYIITLATFFNALRTTFEEDEWEKTVIPRGLVFYYPRRMDNIDNLSKVNNNIVDKYFKEFDPETIDEDTDLTDPKNIVLDFPERDADFGTFKDHCYKFPQGMTIVKHEDDLIFFDPHQIKYDEPSSQAFVATVHALQALKDVKNYKLILNTLNTLDAFEITFLKQDKEDYKYTPYSFDSVEKAQEYVNHLLVPDDVEGARLRYICMIKYVFEQNGRKQVSYELKMFKKGTYDPNYMGY